MTFDRRSYLKGAVLMGGAVFGLQGAITESAQSQSGGQQGAPALQGRACPPGTRELARYSVDDGSFAPESGDDVISVSEVPGQGPVRSFSWEAPDSDPIAVVTVRNGPNRHQFEGGFEGDVDVEGPPISSVSFCVPRGGRAVLCELDGMGASAADMNNGLSGITYDTEFHLDGDPSFDYPDDPEDSDVPREGVVHIVSTGHTLDYAHAMVNVVSRTEERVTLSELTNLTFDYYEGGGNAGAMPDEVFVTFLMDDQLYIAYIRPDDAGQNFQTLDLLGLIRKGEWRVEDVAFMDVVTSEGAIETAQDLRSAPKERLLDDGGDDYSDAILVGVGFGAGNTRSQTGIDRYFDELLAGWNTEDGGTSEAMFEFPALLPLTVEEAGRPGNGRGPLEVTLSFTQDEIVEPETATQEGGTEPARTVELEEVIEDTVTLNAFGSFAPPPEPGAAAESVAVEEEEEEVELVVRFRPQDVDTVLEGPRFIISGDFESRPGYSFFATGELE